MKRFICIEGIDGVGKTTIAQDLAADLGVEYYKSPGGGFAEARKLVDQSIDPVTRYFFYRAAVQYDSHRIAEILETRSVVCDRYIYSTFAFHQAMDARLAKLFELTDLKLPDIIIVLTAETTVRLSRLQERNSVSSIELDIGFQLRAEMLLKEYAHHVLDNTRCSKEELVRQIKELLKL